jgi:hypothetical protein
MSYHKRIILDFDDTLAFAENRDWINARPNDELIVKTNKLYDEGWQIDIFTARGNLSCATRAEAAAKYQPDMEEWLKMNGVKYHSISFEKPLAAYYIDDKGMSPEDFIEVNIQKLEGGLSGSDIFTDGKMVHKQDLRAHDVKSWYENAEDLFINVPRVDRIVGETITMEYIEHEPDYFKHNFHVALGLAQEVLEHMKKGEPGNSMMFADYIYRIGEHVKAADVDLFYSVLADLSTFDLKPSFAHGDFGVTNLLYTMPNEVFVIDPIPEVFGCTELDAAKLVASMYVNQYDPEQIRIATQAMAIYNSIDKQVFDVLVASELIRIYKYHPDKNFIMECVRACY